MSGPRTLSCVRARVCGSNLQLHMQVICIQIQELELMRCSYVLSMHHLQNCGAKRLHQTPLLLVTPHPLTLHFLQETIGT